MERLLVRIALILGIGLLLYGVVCGIAIQYIWPGWDFSKSGPMGDTIGGILSPLMNLVGAILVYFSFKEQQAANRIQIKELKEDRLRASSLNKFTQLINLVLDIDEMYNNFVVTSLKENTVDTSVSYGALAFNDFIIKVHNIKEDKDRVRSYYNVRQEARDCNSFLDVILYAGNGIIKYPPSDDHSRRVLKIKFLNVVSKLESPIQELSIAANSCSNQYINLTDLNRICVRINDLIQEMKGSKYELPKD